MVFAHGIKLDVFDQNDFARVGIEESAIYNIGEALAITDSEKFKGPGSAVRRFQEALTLRIFTDRFKEIAERFLHPGEFRSTAARKTSDPPFGCLELGFVICQGHKRDLSISTPGRL